MNGANPSFNRLRLAAPARLAGWAPSAGGMAPIIMPVDMVMGMGMAAGALGGRGGRGRCAPSPRRRPRSPGGSPPQRAAPGPLGGARSRVSCGVACSGPSMAFMRVLPPVPWRRMSGGRGSGRGGRGLGGPLPGAKLDTGQWGSARSALGCQAAPPCSQVRRCAQARVEPSPTADTSLRLPASVARLRCCRPTPASHQRPAASTAFSAPLAPAGGTVREYFDLDAPQNNRAVLDYGDL